MPALFFVPLALPLACLAGVSLFGFLGVFAIAGALQVVALTSSSAERSSGSNRTGSRIRFSSAGAIGGRPRRFPYAKMA